MYEHMCVCVLEGTGTPEAGGFTSRELLGILRELQGMHIVGADIVEVAPSYDHAEITSLAGIKFLPLIIIINKNHNNAHKIGTQSDAVFLSS